MSDDQDRTGEVPSGLAPGMRCLMPHAAPQTPEQLHAWLRYAIGVVVPRAALTGGADTPFDYLCHAFFEPSADALAIGDAKPRDAVVWAARGGGKTFYAAVATALDLVFKPGVQVRILGGSLEQSKRMHEHLRTLFATPALAPLVARTATGRPAITERSLVLANGSKAEVLAQSATSVRGTRPHKLRCDETELFDREVWRAAQLTTRSERLACGLVHGAIEAISTHHEPDGLMGELIDGSRTRGNHALFRWSVIDTLERCPPGPEAGGDGPDCRACPIEPECGGAAKRVPPSEQGHVSVADAIRLKSRSTDDDWRAEMMTEPPRDRAAAGLAVLPEFDASIHVTSKEPELERPVMIAGMDFGLRSPTVVLFALTEGNAAVRSAQQRRQGDAFADGDHSAMSLPPVHIVAEHAASGVLLDHHVHAILTNPHVTRELLWIAVDPAGRQRNDQTGLSPIDLMRRSGLNVRARPLRIEPGIRLLRARLSPAAGPPTLTIDPRCTELIRSIRQYRYAAPIGDAATPAKDGPDHAVDALRYMLTTLDGTTRTRLFT